MFAVLYSTCFKRHLKFLNRCLCGGRHRQASATQAARFTRIRQENAVI